MPRKPRTGRPRLGDAGLTLSLAIKISPAQRAEWDAAAESAGLTLGAWIRWLASKELGDSRATTLLHIR